MTAENTPAASLPTSRQRCDMRRAAMVLAAAVIPVAGAAPAQAALVNVPATHPALGQTAAVGIAATPAVAPARHLPTIPIQTAPSTVTRYVDVNMANVRSGPSMSNSVVGSVSRGTKVTGTIVNGWLKTSNGRYIGLSVLRSGSGSSSSGSSSSSSTVTRYVTAGAGNVRSGAGLGYRVVGTLSRDTKVTGTMTSNGWLKMSNGRYISSVILTSSRPQSSASRDDVSSGGSSSVSSNAVLREAEKYFGIMYLWGGETPAGFDCSGYTQYVHAQLGISLPRTAAQQQAFATPVSNPQPGDLVFWGSPAWHVAIYAGDGMIYDSGRAGIPVQKRNMFSGVTGYGSVN